MISSRSIKLNNALFEKKKSISIFPVVSSAVFKLLHFFPFPLCPAVTTDVCVCVCERITTLQLTHGGYFYRLSCDVNPKNVEGLWEILLGKGWRTQHKVNDGTTLGTFKTYGATTTHCSLDISLVTNVSGIPRFSYCCNKRMHKCQFYVGSLLQPV